MPPRRTTLKKSLLAIERAFAEIEATVATLSTRVGRLERGDTKKPASTKAVAPRKLHITPKRRAQLKLQGGYIGNMRYLRPAQKLRVKAVKEKRGFEAAAGVARKLAG